MQSGKDSNLTATISYFWWIGWFIALVMFLADKDRKEFTQFHLKQSLILHVLWTIITVFDLFIDDFLAHSQLLIWITWMLLITIALDGIISALRREQRKIFIVGWICSKIFKNSCNEVVNNQRT